MKFTILVTISALLGYTLAVGGSIKQRLSEITANNQDCQLPVCTLPLGPTGLPDPDLDFCTVNLTMPPISGSGAA